MTTLATLGGALVALLGATYPLLAAVFAAAVLDSLDAARRCDELALTPSTNLALPGAKE